MKWFSCHLNAWLLLEMVEWSLYTSMNGLARKRQTAKVGFVYKHQEMQRKASCLCPAREFLICIERLSGVISFGQMYDHLLRESLLTGLYLKLTTREGAFLHHTYIRSA